jgi:hypothetical protein
MQRDAIPLTSRNFKTISLALSTLKTIAELPEILLYMNKITNGPIKGHIIAWSVEALCYKPEDRGFHS